MRSLAIITFLIVLGSCEKDTQSIVDWMELKEGVIQKDNLKIENEIIKLLANTSPMSSDNDAIGQKNNINNLIVEINKSDILKADLLCYACIETYPAQSEITITTDSLGTSISRIIDILTPSDNVLKFINIHNNCADNCYDEQLFQVNKNNFCPQDCPGVIGCDGETYCNECEALKKGIKILK